MITRARNVMSLIEVRPICLNRTTRCGQRTRANMRGHTHNYHAHLPLGLARVAFPTGSCCNFAHSMYIYHVSVYVPYAKGRIMQYHAIAAFKWPQHAIAAFLHPSPHGAFARSRQDCARCACSSAHTYTHSHPAPLNHLAGKWRGQGRRVDLRRHGGGSPSLRSLRCRSRRTGTGQCLSALTVFSRNPLVRMTLLIAWSSGSGPRLGWESDMASILSGWAVGRPRRVDSAAVWQSWTIVSCVYVMYIQVLCSRWVCRRFQCTIRRIKPPRAPSWPFLHRASSGNHMYMESRSRIAGTICA